jgi:alpha-D-ribose 1-methylphosphonate 5-triphosphate synthase subunit PhnL
MVSGDWDNELDNSKFFDTFDALILPQKLLLLDEPTAPLYAYAHSALIARIQKLNDHGTAMIGVFHQPDDVAI